MWSSIFTKNILHFPILAKSLNTYLGGGVTLVKEIYLIPKVSKFKHFCWQKKRNKSIILYLSKVFRRVKFCYYTLPSVGMRYQTLMAAIVRRRPNTTSFSRRQFSTGLDMKISKKLIFVKSFKNYFFFFTQKGDVSANTVAATKSLTCFFFISKCF